MKTTRRNFLISASLGTAGLGLLSSFDSYTLGPDDLPRATPESQGVDTRGILNFLQAIQTSDLEWHSFMLVRHGNVVAEGWWKPFSADYKHTLYSLSKSFTSTAIGFLVTEGKISVNDPVIKFFPNDLPATVGDNLKAMTVRSLLTMNTGHDTDTMPKFREYNPQSWIKTFLAQPVQHQPGSHFLYNTGATYMLGAIVQKVTGQLLEEYLQPRLFGPLGITGYDWEKSPEGLNTAGYGLRVKTEDIARFGQLYLQKGQWQGKQLLPASWIEEATSKQTTSQAGDGDWAQGYGYQFWRCKPGFYRGDGAYGQFCIVMPEQDAVLVMTSESKDLQKSMNIAYETLLPAFAKGQLPENSTQTSFLKKELSQLELPPAKGESTPENATKYSDKRYQMAENSFGIKYLSVGLNPKNCVLKMETPQGVEKITFGWNEWALNSQESKIRFPVPTRLEIPSKVAGSAAWIDDHTLKLKMKFVEAIHGDTLTLTWQNDTISVAFLNSVTEKTKSFPEKRNPLTGTLQA